MDRQLLPNANLLQMSVSEVAQSHPSDLLLCKATIETLLIIPQLTRGMCVGVGYLVYSGNMTLNYIRCRHKRFLYRDRQSTRCNSINSFVNFIRMRPVSVDLSGHVFVPLHNSVQRSCYRRVHRQNSPHPVSLI